MKFVSILRVGVCALTLGLGVSTWATAAEFLPPDQAFRLQAQVQDGRTLALDWQIAPGYYLYRERTAVTAEPASVQWGPVQLPAGKVKYDENFEKDVEIYHDRLHVVVPVQAAPTEFRLSVTSQGCAEQGLCYPPRQRTLKVRVQDRQLSAVEVLPDAQAQWQPAAGGAAMALEAGVPRVAQVSEASKEDGAGWWSLASGGWSGFESALKGGSLWTVAGVFLLAGVLLSFTPCVLPMVPILSSIIVGQGGAVSRWRGLSLSLAYALGMALVYTGMGMAAGLAGEGLAAALQTPAVLTGFAVLLVVLSLSMFGVYELQLPSALQNRLNEQSGRFSGGRYGAVFAMGGLSALIVGPCVAAPLAGALLYISQTRDVVLGGLALFSMAVGMSVPLLLVGVSAGTLLPRAGGWMESVKRVFGLLLLAVALWMVAPVWPAWALGLACALWLLVAAWAVWKAFKPGRGAVLRGVLVSLLLALAAAEVVDVTRGGGHPLQPWRAWTDGRGGSAAGEHAAPLPFRRIKTVAELEEVVRTAGRPVMLDFYADWCVACKEMERFTFTDARVRQVLEPVLLLQADVTANDEADKALLKRFNLFGPPGIMFFDAQGRELPERKVVGFQPAEEFLRSLKAAGL